MGRRVEPTRESRRRAPAVKGLCGSVHGAPGPPAASPRAHGLAFRWQAPKTARMPAPFALRLAALASPGPGAPTDRFAPPAELPSAALGVLARFETLGPAGRRRLARAMGHRRPAFDPIYQRVAWHELRQGPEFRAWCTCSLVLEHMIGIDACDDVERASLDDHEALDAAEDACLAAIVAPRLPYEATVLAGPWIARSRRRRR